METIDIQNLVTATGGNCGPRGCFPAYVPAPAYYRSAPRWAYGPAAYGPGAYAPYGMVPARYAPPPRFWY